MELDHEGEHAHRTYALLVSLVTPRPIAWVTSLSRDGQLNAAAAWRVRIGTAAHAIALGWFGQNSVFQAITRRTPDLTCPYQSPGNTSDLVRQENI